MSVEVLERAAALREQGAAVHARPLLVAALATPDLDAEVETQLRNELGLTLKALGEYEAARAEYRTALAAVRSRPGPADGDDDDAATLLHNLAGVAYVLGDLEEAAARGREGLSMRRRLHPADAMPVLLDEGNLAPILLALGDLDGAEAMLRRLLAHLTERLGPDDAEVAVILTNLGAVAAERADWPSAHAHLERAVRLKAAAHGPDHPELVVALVNLAYVTARAGDREAAEASLGRARAIARETLPPDHDLRRHAETLDLTGPG